MPLNKQIHILLTVTAYLCDDFDISFCIYLPNGNSRATSRLSATIG